MPANRFGRFTSRQFGKLPEWWPLVFLNPIFGFGSLMFCVWMWGDTGGFAWFLCFIFAPFIGCFLYPIVALIFGDFADVYEGDDPCIFPYR